VESETDPIITINDARKAGYCVNGMRKWARHHNLDFKDFVKNGLPASKLLATGDQLGINIVNRAKDK